MEKKKWFYVAISGVAVSILSLFYSIVSYTDTRGRVFHYNVIDLLTETDFQNRVLSQYTGPVLWVMDGYTVGALAVLAVAAVICTLVGLFTLRKQRPNTWQFVLTLAGLVGTTFPSFLVLLAVALSDNYFRGDISCGVSPIITPIAMTICIFAVVRRRNKVLEQLRQEMEAKGLVFQAGDL